MSDYVLDEVWEEVKEPLLTYASVDPINNLTYKRIGAYFEVYNELGKGFSEVVYKDALEHEFKLRGIPCEREKKYDISYKDIILSHHFFADFIIDGRVILEVKAKQGVIDDHYKQVINYLAVSDCSIGLIVNFGESSLKYKRVILTK
jgi:GxxExxY protein